MYFSTALLQDTTSCINGKSKKFAADIAPEPVNAIVNRLSRAIGHLECVKRMVQDEREANETLIQLAAVISALNNTGKLILQEYIEDCIVIAVKSGEEKAIEDLNKAIIKFIK